MQLTNYTKVAKTCDACIFYFLGIHINFFISLFIPLNLLVLYNKSFDSSVFGLSKDENEEKYSNSHNTHRTTGCFDDRLLTMMTDTGFYVP